MGMEAQAVVGEKDEFTAARGQFEILANRLRSAEAIAMTHSELEVLVEKEGREVLRLLLQDHLRLRSEHEVVVEQVTGADGVARTHHREHDRPLMTVLGPVRVERMGYGAEGGTSLHPLDAQLNLPTELYSHEVRRRMAEEVARGSYDEAVAAVGRNTGAEVPKRQAEELAKRAATDFDAFYEGRRAASAAEEARTGELVVLTSDGKGVPMRAEHLREETRKAAEKQAPLTPLSSKEDEEKRNRKRMGTVAAVYTVERYERTAEDVLRDLRPVKEVPRETSKRPEPEKKRVWASIEKGPEPVIQDVFEEAIRRDPLRQKQWAALVDGNETQLALLQKMAEQFGVELTVVLDVMHVLGYVWRAAGAFHGDDDRQAREKWVDERLLEILRGRASEVAGGIRRSATLRKLRGRKRMAADKCADYLLKYRDFLHYDEYLADGLPIATGVVEGACRYLVKDRAEITGATWSIMGAEAVLRLRALRASGDFEAYWKFHLKQELKWNHASQYAGQIPVTIPQPRKAHLRVVK